MAEHGHDFEVEHLDQQIERPAGSLDTNARRLVEDLHQMYQAAPADSAANTASLQQVQRLLQTRQSRSSQQTKIIALTKLPEYQERKSMIGDTIVQNKSGWHRFSRALSAIAAVFIIVLLIGSAFALLHAKPSTLSRPIRGSRGSSIQPLDCSHVFDHGEHAICLQGEETPLHATTTINGHKLTLIAGYADANRALVQFAMNGKLEWYDNVFIDSLTIQGNIQLPGSGSGSFDFYYESQQNQTVELVGFDTREVPVGTINMNVTAHLRAMKVPSTPSPTSQQPNEVHGTINFTLPFHSTRRAATPSQTMSINGHAITLERVVVTASETTLFLKNDRNLPPWGSVNATGTLDNFNLLVSATTTAPGNGKNGALTGWEMVLQESLLSKQGTWTLHFVSTGLPLGTGTATFQFSIPASA